MIPLNGPVNRREFLGEELITKLPDERRLWSSEAIAINVTHGKVNHSAVTPEL